MVTTWNQGSVESDGHGYWLQPVKSSGVRTSVNMTVIRFGRHERAHRQAHRRPDQRAEQQDDDDQRRAGGPPRHRAEDQDADRGT